MLVFVLFPMCRIVNGDVKVVGMRELNQANLKKS